MNDARARIRARMHACTLRTMHTIHAYAHNARVFFLSIKGSGDLHEAVKLPPGEDLNEWIAVNTVDFFNQINMLYGTLTEFCTAESCPVMSAGPKYEYVLHY